MKLSYRNLCQCPGSGVKTLKSLSIALSHMIDDITDEDKFAQPMFFTRHLHHLERYYKSLDVDQVNVFLFFCLPKLSRFIGLVLENGFFCQSDIVIWRNFRTLLGTCYIFIDIIRCSWCTWCEIRRMSLNFWYVFVFPRNLRFWWHIVNFARLFILGQRRIYLTPGQNFRHDSVFSLHMVDTCIYQGDHDRSSTIFSRHC